MHKMFDHDEGFEFYLRLHMLHACSCSKNEFNLLADVLMVVGAVLIGYATCMLQQGFGPSFFSRMVFLLLVI